MKSKKDTVNPSDQFQLFIVGSPIGNLGDISYRAMEVFENVEWVAAEDTRETRKLFNALKVKNKPDFHSIHAHSSPGDIAKLLDRVKSKGDGAYLSDAGTPGVSDPGADLVRIAIEGSWRVTPIPGASALTSFLSILDSNFELPVHFYGFFPRVKKEQREVLDMLKGSAGTHVFFESPKRILSTLEQFSGEAELSDLHLTVGRELTKLHEEVLRGNSGSILQSLKAKPSIKGEFVFAFSGAKAETRESTKDATLLTNLVAALDKRGIKVDQKTFTELAKVLGWKRNDAYELGLELKAQGVLDTSPNNS